jgi:RluA family pseudouridine synthase
VIPDSQTPKTLGATIKISSPTTREFWEIPVLYENDELLGLNKPAGLSIAPTQADPAQPSLMALLHQGIAQTKPWAAERRLVFLMYAHRLDSEASGVLLFAKSKAMLSRLLDLFGSEKATLSYVTLASGHPAEDRFSVASKLAQHPTKPGVMRADNKFGKRSQTAFEIIERFHDWTLLRCQLLTNRPHQVRVHLGRVGMRAAGDEVYGGKPLLLSRIKPDFRLKPGHKERPLIDRACLHVERLTISLPGEEVLVLEAPWPKDLQVALKYLRKFALRSEG